MTPKDKDQAFLGGAEKRELEDMEKSLLEDIKKYISEITLDEFIDVKDFKI